MAGSCRSLFIDSRDRISGTPTNFSIQLREQLVVGPARQFRIDELRVPLVIPLVNAGLTDTMYFTLGAGGTGAVRQITLAEGNYSGTDYASKIQQALTALAIASTTFTVAYNNATAGLSIFCSNPEFRVLTDALATAAGKSLPTLASALFQNTYSYTPTGGGVTLAWSYCSVQAVDMMYLCSVRLGSQDTFGPSGSTDTLMCAIPNQDFATVLVSSMPWDVWMECPAISTNILDFTLRDRNYNVLPDLPNISFVVSIR